MRFHGRLWLPILLITLAGIGVAFYATPRSGPVIASISLDQDVEAMGVDASIGHALLYALDSHQHAHIVVIDTRTGQVLGHVAVPQTPPGTGMGTPAMVVDAGAHRALLTLSGGVVTFDTETGAFLASVPLAGPFTIDLHSGCQFYLPVSTQRTYLAPVTSAYDGVSTTINTLTGHVLPPPIGRGDVPLWLCLHRMARDPRTGDTYLVGDSIAIRIQTRTGKSLGEVPLSSVPGYVVHHRCEAMSLPERRTSALPCTDPVVPGVVPEVVAGHTFTLNARQQALEMRDASTGALLRQLPLPTFVYTVLVDAPAGRVIVGVAAVGLTDPLPVTILTIDARTGRLVNSVSLHTGRNTIALDKRAGRILVQDQQFGRLSLLDAVSGRYLRAINDGDPESLHGNLIAVDEGSGHVIEADTNLHTSAFTWLPSWLPGISHTVVDRYSTNVRILAVSER